MAARRKKRSSKAPATRPREDEKEAKTDDILLHNQRPEEETFLDTGTHMDAGNPPGHAVINHY